MAIRATRLPILLFATVACAAANSAEWPKQNDPRPPRAVAGTVLLTAADLARYTAGGTLLEALEHSVPQVLRGRGTQPRVVIDGAAAGDLTLLETLRVSIVSEVRLVRASASARSASGIDPGGAVVSGDILLVTTRRQ